MMRPCLRYLALAASVAFTLASAPALGQAPPSPFAAGDPNLGRPMVEKDCVACHARRMDGDAARMYTRADRKVRTPAQLLAQVRYCNSQLGTHYFPEEEEHIAAYLNRQYYHFQ